MEIRLRNDQVLNRGYLQRISDFKSNNKFKEGSLMKLNKVEIVAGSFALATLTGAAVAALKYRNIHKPYSRNFDPSAIEDLMGKVEEIAYAGHENGEGRGVELLLRTDEELISVHLGPAWYLDMQSEKIKPGQKISVRGSRVMHNQEPILIAETITRGDKVLRIRSEEGYPVWSARWNRQAG
jgi:hypothetical protein